MDRRVIFFSSPYKKEGHFDQWENAFIKFFESSNLPFVILEDQRIMLENLLSAMTKQPKAHIKFREQKVVLSGRYDKVYQRPKYMGNSSLVSRIARRYVWNFIPLEYKHKIVKVVQRLLSMEQNFANYKTRELLELQKLVTLKCIYPESSLIFFSYLDYFKNISREEWNSLESSLQSKWVACLFDPDNFPTENLNELESLRVIIVTSEYARKRVQKDLVNQRIDVLIAPDFVPTSYIHAPPEDMLNERILNPEGSISHSVPTQNPKILLAGSISERKNLDLFLRCASSEQGANFTWVIGGKIHREMCSEFALDFLDNKASAFTNIQVINRYLTDKELEDLVRSSSVLFSIYKEWEYASNIVSRAAICNVPVLVGNGKHISEIVQQNSLGLIISIPNVSSVFDGITELLNKPNYFHASEKFKETLSEQNFIDFLGTVVKKIDR
jgi:glycosyltransferase involved in cell wall biosynthesis